MSDDDNVVPFYRTDPALVEEAIAHMHELVELGWAIYKGDGTDTYLLTDLAFRLLGPMLSFAETFVRSAPKIEYDEEAWLEVKVEWGVLVEMWNQLPPMNP